MPLIDAVHVIEKVCGILLGMSGIAFILLGVFVKTHQKSAIAEVLKKRDGHKLDLVAKSEKRPTPKKTPARKAA